MLNKTLQAPTAKRKCQSFGKITRQKWTIFVSRHIWQKGGRKSCFLPISQSWETDTPNPCPLSTGRPARPLTMLISLSLFNSRATPCFLCVSHSFHNEHRYCYNQEEKTIYMLKIWQGTSAFKIVTLGHVFTSPLIQRFFEMIQ